MSQCLTHPALALRAVVVVAAFVSSHAQAGTTVSAKGLWDMLALPQPKYSFTGWGGGGGLTGDWVDRTKLAQNLPVAKVFKIVVKLDYSPKGDEAFKYDTTPALEMLVHEFGTAAEAETAWKDGFDAQYVQKPTGPSSGEQIEKIVKWINQIGQPKSLAIRESMLKANQEIPPPGTTIRHLKTSDKRLEDMKLGPVKDECGTSVEGDPWWKVSVQHGAKRRRVIREVWMGTVITRTIITEREKKGTVWEDGKKTGLQLDKDGNPVTYYIYEKRTSRKFGGSREVQRREYEFFLVHNCVVIAQWYELLGFGGVRKAYPPEWNDKIVPLLEKLSGGKLPPDVPAADEGAERVETLHVHAEGYRPTKLKVTLPASAEGWKVAGTITDGKVGIANAVLRWEGSSTTTRGGADGSFSKPFGKKSANPTVVAQDIQLAKSPPIKLAVMEGKVTHPFLPFPIQGASRTVQLVLTGDSAQSLARHRGTIAFRNAKKLPFITLDARPQTLDATGKWSVPVTVRKLVPSEVFSLADLPMAAEFEVAIEMPRWHTAIARATFTVPLGAFIMMGSTVGPDYKKRYTPLAPEAITALHLAYPERVKAGEVRNVHLLGQVNSQGDFWTLVRAPERGDSTDILLQWSNLCKLPLLLPIGGRGGFKPDMVGKKQLLQFERAAGNIDLLSPEEHEARIRDLVVDFVRQMPLKSGPRGDLVTQVKNLTFTYGETATRPHWNGSGIVLPGEKRELWGKEPYGRIAKGERAMYVLAFHEIGHALHEFTVEKLGRIAWVRKLTYGAAEHATWEPAKVTMPMPTVGAPGLSWKVRRKAVAFTEATAEFFAWCMYNHLDKAHADAFGKSVYYERDYLAQFDTDTLALAACHHGGWEIEGVQATFLRALYAGLPAPLAYGDFLRTMALYQGEHFFLRWVPARAIDEWVAMKLKHGGPGGDARALASKFNIVGGPAIFLQVARSGVVRVNGNAVRMGGDQAHFQRLVVGDKVAIESGQYLVNFTATSSKAGVMDAIRVGAMAVREGCEFEITGPLDVQLVKGRFASGGVNTATPVGMVRHKKTSYVVEIGADGATTVEVVDGAIEIETARGKTEVDEGKAVHVDRGGGVRPVPPRGSQALRDGYDPTAPAAIPAPDPVGTEMQAIERLLQQGQAAAATPRMTRTLPDLWKQHRRTDWNGLLGWVREVRIRYPALADVGRYRLPTLERELQEYAKQEQTWSQALKDAQASPDLHEQIRKLEAFVRFNLDSLYREDAEAHIQKLRDDLVHPRSTH